MAQLLKILIVDDHALFREGVVYILKKLADDVQVLEAPTLKRAQQLLQEHDGVSLVLLDLHLQDADGFTALECCLEQYPRTPVAIISASTKPTDMQRALDMGAAGYIPKNTTGELMLSALRMILAGGYYVPKELLSGAATEAPVAEVPHITARQAEVLTLICDGKTNKEIASALGVAEATVKMHITSIFRSLDVNNRTQLVKVAQEHGLA